MDIFNCNKRNYFNVSRLGQLSCWPFAMEFRFLPQEMDSMLRFEFHLHAKSEMKKLLTQIFKFNSFFNE